MIGEPKEIALECVVCGSRLCINFLNEVLCGNVGCQPAGQVVSIAPREWAPEIPVGGWTPYAPPMTLRDWFAGQALMGAIVNADIDSNVGEIANAADFARAMYQMADAMIAERDAKP